MSRKVIFLDRDGPINVDSGYVHKIEDWQWQPKAIEGMKVLQAAGYVLTIVTNQSAIGHGLYSENDMHAVHAYMLDELKKAGVAIAAIAFCPHDRGSTCDCRKPGIGMIKQIEAKIGAIDYVHSWTIGDKIADLQMGKKAGTHTALLRSQYWQADKLVEQPDLVVDSLYEASLAIRKNPDA